MSPHQVRSATFKSSRKGYDPEEVSSFLERVAEALEAAQNHSTAMEARARAAIARLQEATATAEVAARPTEVTVEPDQAEVISRTLVLAQRTADATVAEARVEADRILEAARSEAATTLDSTREMSAKMLEDARAEVRTIEGEERARVRNEVEALLARREFVLADVDHLESFLVEQRNRLREAAATLLDLTERVPGGLGAMSPPLLSAVADAEVGASDDVDDDAEVGVSDDADDDAGDRLTDGAAEGPAPVPVDEPAGARVDATTDGDFDATAAEEGAIDSSGDGVIGAAVDGDDDDHLSHLLDEAGSEEVGTPLDEEPLTIAVSSDDPTPPTETEQLRFGSASPVRSDPPTASL